jgi:hypothetical protein
MWFDFVLHDVYGLPYFYAPGAIDIWQTPGSLVNNFFLIGYSPTLAINKGDIVVYDGGVGSPYGHVSIAAQDGVGSNYVGYDSNWGDSKILQTITHNDRFNSAIIGILRSKEANMPSVISSVEANKGFAAFWERSQLEAAAAAAGQTVDEWVNGWAGTESNAFINALGDSQQFTNKRLDAEQVAAELKDAQARIAQLEAQGTPGFTPYPGQLYTKN